MEILRLFNPSWQNWTITRPKSQNFSSISYDLIFAFQKSYHLELNSYILFKFWTMLIKLFERLMSHILFYLALSEYVLKIANERVRKVKLAAKSMLWIELSSDSKFSSGINFWHGFSLFNLHLDIIPGRIGIRIFMDRSKCIRIWSIPNEIFLVVLSSLKKNPLLLKSCQIAA